MTFATPFSNTATQELVVPKSMPIILAIESSYFDKCKSCCIRWGLFFRLQVLLLKTAGVKQL
jgi:hypothetical protein